MKKRIVAVIPARGGSKSIPQKNIRDFCGKPLISWAIRVALDSESIDRVIVTTDCSKIAAIALEEGAEVPFVRDSTLSTDEIGIEPVLGDVCEWLEKNENYKVDYVCLLLPTNPLRTTSHIDECCRLVVEKSLECVFTVNEVPANHTPFWSIVKKGRSVRYFESNDLKSPYKRRQDFPLDCYAKNDLVFVMSRENFRSHSMNIFGEGEKVDFIETPAYYDGDINTLDEWKLTEHLFKYLSEAEV